MPAQLELYKKYGYHVQLRYVGEPLCYAVAETGELNTFTHIWVYESAGDRDRTADAVVSRVYRGLKESLVPLARENVMAHLLKLEREGRARVDEDVWTMIGP